MPYASLAEIYFIAGMFVLIIIISVVACYFFYRTYQKEKLEKQKRIAKQKSKPED